MKTFFLFLSFAMCLIQLNIVFADNSQENKNLVQPKAFFKDTSIWPNNRIPICWERDLLSVYNNTSYNRKLVRKAVLRTWGSESLLNFVGWNDENDDNDWCPSGYFYGVRISMGEESVSHGLGTDVLNIHPTTGERGLTLDFNLDNRIAPTNAFPGFTMNELCWFNGKNHDQCIEFVAVHEFGHMLGLSHEQNRPDDNGNSPCYLDDPLINNVQGNSFFTRYDPNSIMNYCRQDYYGDSSLSRTDKLAIKAYYGNIPSYNIATGILTIPRLRYVANNQTYRVELYYDGTNLTLRNFTAINISSKAEATLGYNFDIDIPLFKVVPNDFTVVRDEVYSLFKMNLTYSNGFIYSINSIAEHPHVFPAVNNSFFQPSRLQSEEVILPVSDRLNSPGRGRGQSRR